MHIAPDYYGTRGVQYHNFAIRGTKTDQIAQQIQYELDMSRKIPTLILIHVGANDFNKDQLMIKHQICSLVAQVNTMVAKLDDSQQHQGIIFSAILPCQSYPSMQSFKKGIAKTKVVNGMVHTFINKTSTGWYLNHNNISPRCSENYCKGDNVHLANPGIKLFIDNIVAKVNEILTVW